MILTLPRTFKWSLFQLLKSCFVGILWTEKVLALKFVIVYISIVFFSPKKAHTVYKVSITYMWSTIYNLKFWHYFKGLVAWRHSFFVNYSITDIQYNSSIRSSNLLSPISISPHRRVSAAGTVYPWIANSGYELGPAVQRANALPTEQLHNVINLAVTFIVTKRSRRGRFMTQICPYLSYEVT